MDGIMKSAKIEAYEKILSIFRMMAYAGVTMYIIPFAMQEIIKEYSISNMEIDMLRRRIIYEFNYNPD